MHKKKSSAPKLTPNEKTLEVLANGGRIERRPARPFPPRYTLVTVKREFGHVTESTSDISESRVLALTSKGWVKGEPKDVMWDLVVFHATPAGLDHLDSRYADGEKEVRL